MVDKILHYSLTNPATIYDEEAMTALELAGRTAAKVNECVEEVNDIPRKIDVEVDDHIKNGDFDSQIDAHTQEVVETVENALHTMEEETALLSARVSAWMNAGDTSGAALDAEIIDMRVDADAKTHASAGEAARAHQIRRTIFIEDDLDNYTTPMWGVVKGGAANAPCKHSGIVANEVSSVGSGWIVQRYYSAYDNSTYWRTKQADNPWSDWHDYSIVNRDTFIEDDLDNYTSPMWGVVKGTADNAPTLQSGVLTVEKADTGTGWIVQRYFSVYDDGAFWRTKQNDNAWSEWHDYSPIDRTTFIEDDLNNYTTPMWAVVKGTAANAPTLRSGVLTVEKANIGTGWIVQRYYSALDNSTYWRTKQNDNPWSDWHTYGRQSYAMWIDAETDLNTITPDEYYYAMCDVAAINAPDNTTHHGMLALIPFSSGANYWYAQIWIDTDFSHVFGRACRNDVWTGWEILYKRGAVPDRKTIVFMGDSLFGNNQTDTGVVNLFEAKTGHICHNFATGSGRATNHGSVWDAFDSAAMAEAIVTGDFSVQEAALQDTSVTWGDYFPATVEKMKAFDFSKTDIMVIDWGTNDWNGGRTVEEYTAALAAFINKINTKYPKIRFFLMGVPERWIKVDEVYKTASDLENSAGITLREFADGQEAWITRKNRIPYINMLDIGINTLNRSHFFPTGDYTHHNENGRAVLADKLAKEVF